MRNLSSHDLSTIARALARRPDLWATSVSQTMRLARPGWWRDWPPLPFPDADYLRFRIQTAYGDPEQAFDAADLVAYLDWCYRMRRLAR